MTQDEIATAGQVRLDGRDHMRLASLAPRHGRWGLPVSGTFLALGFVVPHAGLDVPSVYAFGLAASLVCLEFAWTHVPRQVRAECIAWGLATAALFFGLAGAGIPNAAIGPVLLAVPLGLSWWVWRAHPARGHEPPTSARVAAFLVLTAAMWATIMAVRTLQHWPLWS